jgi:transposase-like protein
MPRTKTTYSEEVKAQAMAALMTGQSINSVAREYNLPKGTVSDWKAQATTGVGLQPTQNTREDASDVGGLLLTYLRTNLRALTAQAETFADPLWLRGQDASQLAVLHGVMTDKAVRLLEAMSASNPQ